MKAEPEVVRDSSLQDVQDQVRHLLVALEHRTLTGRATGIVMERFGLSGEEAFGVLLRLSSELKMKLYDVAQRLTETGEVPGLQPLDPSSGDERRPRSGSTSSIRVVVIDDSADIRDVLRLALDREADFEVVGEAADGEAGVAAAEAHQPDLVLLDIAMPVMDGLEALPLIRKRSPGSVVVMLTAFAEADAALSAVEHGAHGYIRKGVGVPELLNQIREILEIRLQVLSRARRT